MKHMHMKIHTVLMGWKYCTVVSEEEEGDEEELQFAPLPEFKLRIGTALSNDLPVN